MLQPQQIFQQARQGHACDVVGPMQPVMMTLRPSIAALRDALGILCMQGCGVVQASRDTHRWIRTMETEDMQQKHWRKSSQW